MTNPRVTKRRSQPDTKKHFDGAPETTEKSGAATILLLFAGKKSRDRGFPPGYRAEPTLAGRWDLFWNPRQAVVGGLWEWEPLRLGVPHYSEVLRMARRHAAGKRLTWRYSRAYWDGVVRSQESWLHWLAWQVKRELLVW